MSHDEVARIAELARLRLDHEQVEHYRRHLSAVLEHAADLDELDLSGVSSTWQAVPLANVWRPDRGAEVLDRDEVLAQAPAAEQGQFRVPPILGEAP